MCAVKPRRAASAGGADRPRESDTVGATVAFTTIPARPTMQAPL